MPRGELRLVACRAGRYMGERVSGELVGMDFSDLMLDKYNFKIFEDGENKQHEFERSLRGDDVYIFQSGARDLGLGVSVDDNFMDLCRMIDGVKHASSKRITVVTPLFPYTRQDVAKTRGEAHTAKLAAKFIEEAGADRLVTIDLHAGQIKDYFEIPVEGLYASHVLIPELQRLKTVFGEGFSKCVFVSTDAGGAKRAKYYHNLFERSGLAIGDKTKDPDYEGVDKKIERVEIVGDVNGMIVISIDDLIASGSSVISEARTAKEKGATGFYCVVTHGLFVGNAEGNFTHAHKEGLIHKVWCTDSVYHSPEFLERNKAWLEEISIARLLAKTIKALHNDEPISEIYGN